jgi:hypothetical protein
LHVKTRKKATLKLFYIKTFIKSPVVDRPMYCKRGLNPSFIYNRMKQATQILRFLLQACGQSLKMALFSSALSWSVNP